MLNKSKEVHSGLWGILLWTMLLLLCILVSIAPLQRMANAPLLSSLPISRLLTFPGSWLPRDFHVMTDIRHSIAITGDGEFLLITLFALFSYGMCVRVVHHLPHVADEQYRRLLRGIFIGASIGGVLFVFTPALPSRDVFVYADYGRAIVAHATNPYFVPPVYVSLYDPITRLNEWNSVPAAYGPFWLAICSLFALFLGDDPVRYIFAFRFLGLTVHLLNTLLVVGILRAMGRSQRTVTLGALLYAYNPLVLMESCLGSHNDALMLTLMLAAVWFMLRAKWLLQPRGYFLPVAIMTLAVLIKFTSAPLLLFFMVLLTRRMLLKGEKQGISRTLAARWQYVIVQVLLAGLLSGVMILLFYLPFWIGRSIPEIVHSFSAPPSASFAENSLLRVLIEWIKLYGLPTRTSYMYYPIFILSQHIVWNVINLITLAIALLIGSKLLWRAPTIQNLVLATLFTLEAILIVTPWFYSWYVLWIVGLAIVLLGSGRANKPFIVFALVFSVSAFFTYLDPYYLSSLPVLGNWLEGRYLLTIMPPILAVTCFLLLNDRVSRVLPTQDDE